MKQKLTKELDASRLHVEVVERVIANKDMDPEAQARFLSMMHISHIDPIKQREINQAIDCISAEIGRN